jgi:hypothetical protein
MITISDPTNKTLNACNIQNMEGTLSRVVMNVDIVRESSVVGQDAGPDGGKHYGCWTIETESFTSCGRPHSKQVL